ncbi:MAG: TraR/DksA family transcriptional regulator [Acidimicrobiales bacterium]
MEAAGTIPDTPPADSATALHLTSRKSRMPKATKAVEATKSAPKSRSTKVPSGAASGAAASPAKPRASARKAATEPSDRFIAEQRALLLAERETYLSQVESLRAEAEQLAEDMEPGDTQFDEESGEGGTMNVERERDLTLIAQARAAVDEIDRALAKVEAGTYGVCEQCGTAIPKARLKALPHASLCVACKSGGLSRR